MSITYAFTERHSIRIECGEEWIEVSLPQAQPAAPRPGAGAAPQVDPETPPKGRKIGGGRPPIYPGAMLVIANGKPPEEGEDYLGGGVDPDSIITLSDLDLAGIEAAMKRTKIVGRSRMLDLKVDTDTRGNIPDLEELNRLIKNPNFDLDGVRLWKE